MSETSLFVGKILKCDLSIISDYIVQQTLPRQFHNGALHEKSDIIEKMNSIIVSLASADYWDGFEQPECTGVTNNFGCVSFTFSIDRKKMRVPVVVNKTITVKGTTVDVKGSVKIDLAHSNSAKSWYFTVRNRVLLAKELLGLFSELRQRMTDWNSYEARITNDVIRGVSFKRLVSLTPDIEKQIRHEVEAISGKKNINRTLLMDCAVRAFSDKGLLKRISKKIAKDYVQQGSLSQVRQPLSRLSGNESSIESSMAFIAMVNEFIRSEHDVSGF
jgi:hypothetical protein